MKSTFFTESKLKIERADKHLKELNSVLRSLRKTGGYHSRRHLNVKTGEKTFAFAAFENKEAFHQVAPIVGDVIHNLRSSLDLVAYKMVDFFGKTPNRYTKFPFRETRKEVIRAIECGAIEGLPLDGQTLIIETIQPYKRGDDPLYMLHALDITDKHHVLIPVFVAPVLKIDIKGKGKVVERIVLSSKRSGEWSEVVVPADTKVKKYHKPVPDISFHGIEGIDKPVLPTLTQLSHLVAKIVEELALFCNQWAARRSA